MADLTFFFSSCFEGELSSYSSSMIDSIYWTSCVMLPGVNHFFLKSFLLKLSYFYHRKTFIVIVNNFKTLKRLFKLCLSLSFNELKSTYFFIWASALLILFTRAEGSATVFLFVSFAFSKSIHSNRKLGRFEIKII